MNKMKILIASDTYYPNLNGASYFTYRLATLLAKRGHQVSVIAPSPTLQETTYLQNGVTVYGAPSKGIIIYKEFHISPSLIAQKGISKFIAKIKPDVIHIQNHFFIGRIVLKIAKELKIPIIGTNHFMPENLTHYLRAPKFIEKKINKLAWKHFFKVFNNLQIITTPTQTAADLLKKVGFKNEVKVVSCGIDLNRFTPTTDSTPIKAKYAIPKNRKVLLYTGRLDREKRINVIIQAMPKILQKINAHLVIAGSGKLRKKLETQATKLDLNDRITFTGFIPNENFQEIYQLADVFINAGIAELQSIVTMEALASGLPVIAANTMALPELVHHGENGYLFPIDNHEELADYVIKILSDDSLQKKMAQKSREMIQKHDIQKAIQIYESIYQQAISQPQP